MASGTTHSPLSPPSSLPDVENGISQTMLQEEQELREEGEQLNALHEQELLRQRQEDIAGGTQAIDKKFEDLDFLLDQSQVRHLIPTSTFHSN
jgi:ATP-dependent DNA helicase